MTITSALRALVFDFDGTIVDTETVEFETWQEVFRSRGCELSLDVWAECIGTTDFTFDVYSHLEVVSGQPVDRAQVRDGWRNAYYDRLTTLEPLPGVREWIADAQSQGLTLAIASCSRYNRIDGMLCRLGLRDAFAAISSRELCERSKPDPQIYVKALELLGAAPYEALAIEDSPNGCMAAIGAGISCVAVANGMTKRLSFPPVGLVIGSLSEVTLEQTVERLGLRHSAVSGDKA